MSSRLRVNPKRAGFTLVEMLVVIAVTVILMGLLIGPLSQSFQLTGRGQAMIEAQDNARTAMMQITRDIQDAMVVYDGLPIYMYTYTNLQDLHGHPHPDSNSVADVVRDPVTGQPIEFRNAMVDLVLPKARYYCTKYHHYLTDAQVAPNQAIEFCPLHPDSPVETRPVEPLQPAGTRVRYFVALRQGYNPNPLDPTLPGGNSPLPRYMNPLLFTMSGSDYNNPYVLYRAEFDPNPTTDAGKRTANWMLPNGQINPNFWYDNTKDAYGIPYSQEWKAQAVAVISPVDTDMVRWIQEGNLWMPQPMTRFTPTDVENDTLQPNKAVVTSTAAGSFPQPPQVPMQYVAQNGHWSGPVNDMTLPLQPVETMGPTPPTGPQPQAFALGPRIQIYDTQTGGPAMKLVYDSAVPNAQLPRERLFTWDSTRGIVNFALRGEVVLKVDGTGGMAPDEGPFSVSLKRDTQSLPLNLVTNLSRTQMTPVGFGSLLNDPLLGPTLGIVPGSEVVEVLDNNGQPIRTFERAGWLGTGQDQIVAQADLQPDQYVIDYSRGLISFSDRDPSLAGLPVRIRYQMHTNKATDLVRVSYATRELFTVNVGLLQFQPGTAQAQEVQLHQQLRLRNLTH